MLEFWAVSPYKRYNIKNNSFTVPAAGQTNQISISRSNQFIHSSSADEPNLHESQKQTKTVVINNSFTVPAVVQTNFLLCTKVRIYEHSIVFSWLPVPSRDTRLSRGVMLVVLKLCGVWSSYDASVSHTNKTGMWEGWKRWKNERTTNLPNYQQ